MDRKGYRLLKDWFDKHRTGTQAESLDALAELRSPDPSAFSAWMERLFWESDALGREWLLGGVTAFFGEGAVALLRKVLASNQTGIHEKKAAWDQLRAGHGDLTTSQAEGLEAAWRFVAVDFPGEDWVGGQSPGDWEKEWSLFVALPERYQGPVLREILAGHPEAALAFLAFGLNRHQGAWKKALEPVAESPHADAARLLLLAFEKAEDRELRKRIRKLNHRRRARGLSACDFEEGWKPKRAVWSPPVPPKPLGLFSFPEPPDSRMVWVVRHRLPKGMMVFGGILHDRKGLVHFFLLELTSREAEAYRKVLLEERELTVVEMDPGYLASRMEDAARTGLPGEEQEALAFQRVRPLLREVIPSPVPEAPIYRVFDGPEQEGSSVDPLGQTGGLLQLPELRSWEVESDLLLPHLGKLEEIAESRIIVHPFQKRERTQACYRDITKELFSHPEYRALWRRRVEDLAWVFHCKGSLDESRRLCELGRCLRDPARDVSRAVFFARLVEKSLEALLRMKKDTQREQPSLILKP